MRKTEGGGVLLNLTDAVARGFAEVMRRTRDAKPDARRDGALVAPIVTGGAETIVGVQRDPAFEAMAMFGLVAFVTASLTPERAKARITEVRAADQRSVTRAHSVPLEGTVTRYASTATARTTPMAPAGCAPCE